MYVYCREGAAIYDRCAYLLERGWASEIAGHQLFVSGLQPPRVPARRQRSADGESAAGKAVAEERGHRGRHAPIAIAPQNGGAAKPAGAVKPQARQRLGRISPQKGGVGAQPPRWRAQARKMKWHSFAERRWKAISSGGAWGAQPTKNIFFVAFIVYFWLKILNLMFCFNMGLKEILKLFFCGFIWFFAFVVFVFDDYLSI